MEYSEKILLLVTGLLVVLAVYLTLTAPVATAPENVSTRDAEALIMKGLLFGTGQSDYAYSYADVSDGYRVEYALAKSGNGSTIEVRNPLSVKKAYFLANDTLLCMDYATASGCASVQGVSDLSNYLNSLRAKFFSDAIIERNRDDLAYLVYHGYARLDPLLADRTVEGQPCMEVSYVLDFSNMSVTEAARFGVGTNTPHVFAWSMCVDNATGYIRERSFNYTAGGMIHSYSSTMLSYTPGAVALPAPPDNLSADIIAMLMDEKQWQIQLANCYTAKQGDDLDKCIASIAADARRKDLCDYAGGRRDRCLVSLVPVTRDTGICALVATPSYRDDCYIELAGAYKNSSWCANVQNASKIGFCMNVSLPVTPLPQNVTPGPGAGNASNSTGNSTVDINKFLNYVEGQGDANATNTSNWPATNWTG